MHADKVLRNVLFWIAFTLRWSYIFNVCSAYENIK